MEDLKYLKFSKVSKVKDPVRSHSTDAGIDLFVPSDFKEKVLGKGDSIVVPMGIKFEVPNGYMLLALNRSSVASKKGLVVGAQVIDAGYSGEYFCNVHKVTGGMTTIEPDEKLIQLVLIPIVTPQLQEVKEEELYNGEKTERAEKGFGSTNEKKVNPQGYIWNEEVVRI